MRTTRKSEITALPLEECLAKTWVHDGTREAGRSVEDHCRIAGAVGEEIVARYNRIYPHLLPEGAHIPLLLHDIGKVCPTFEAKIYDAIDPERRKACQR